MSNFENKDEILGTESSEVENTSKKSSKFVTAIKNFFAPKGIQVEMLRYRPNKVSSNIALLGILCLVLSFCFVYSTCTLKAGTDFSILGFKHVGFWTFFDILLNIILLLILFSSSIKMKNYSITFGIINIVVGAFLVIRPFIYNLQLYTSGCIETIIFTLSLVFLILAGGLSIIAGIITIIRSSALKKYLSNVEAIENEKVVK